MRASKVAGFFCFRFAVIDEVNSGTVKCTDTSTRLIEGGITKAVAATAVTTPTGTIGIGRSVALDWRAKLTPRYRPRRVAHAEDDREQPRAETDDRQKLTHESLRIGNALQIEVLV